MPNVEYTFKNILSEKFSGLPSPLRTRRNQVSIQEFLPPTNPHPAHQWKSLQRSWSIRRHTNILFNCNRNALKNCYKITVTFFVVVLQMQTLKKHLSVKTETDCGVQQHISLLVKHSWYSIFALCLMFFPRIFWLNMVMMDYSSHTIFATNTHKSCQRWSRCNLLNLKAFAQ